MRRVLILTFACCAMLLMSAPAPLAAQETPIFTRMVRTVPSDWVGARGLFSYVDYAALAATFSGGVRPQSSADLTNSDNAALSRWIPVLTSISAGDSDLTSVLRLDAEMREAVGFDFFALDQVLSFGSPPTDGVVYSGRFDEAAIAAAFAKRSYTESALNEVRLWCGDPTCDRDAGLKVNPRDRQPANPFGGALGRREPIALTDGLLFNSADIDVLKQMISAYTEPKPESALPEMLTMTNALLKEGTLLQTWWFARDTVSANDPNGLPAYTLGGFAHIARPDGTQAVYVALVYAGEGAAEAVELLPTRIREYQSLVVRQNYLPMIEERGGTVGEAQLVEDSDTGQSTVLLPISISQEEAPITPEFGITPAPRSQLVFRLFTDSVMRRDLGFLATK